MTEIQHFQFEKYDSFVWRLTDITSKKEQYLEGRKNTDALIKQTSLIYAHQWCNYHILVWRKLWIYKMIH